MAIINEIMKSALRSTTPLIAVFFTLLFYTVFLNLELKKYGYNFSSFIRLGDAYVDLNEIPSKFLVFENSEGYDGQFYYGLALKPFTKKPFVSGVWLDDPAYRQQRILYPLLAWMVTYGKPDYLPHVLIAINLLFLALTAYFGTQLVQMFKFPKIFGLIFPFYSGLLFSFSLNLPEILEVALILWAVSEFERKKYLYAGFILSLAVLAKETALVVPLGYLIFFVVSRLFYNKKGDWIVAILPIITYLIVRIWMLLVWGNLGIEFSIHTGVIFDGFVKFLFTLILPITSIQKTYLLETTYILIFCSIVVYSILGRVLRIVSLFHFSAEAHYLANSYSSLVRKIVKLSATVLKGVSGIEYIFVWLLYLLLSFHLSGFVWNEDYSYMRVLGEFFIVGFLVLLKLRSKLFYFAFFTNIFLWVYLARNLILFR